MDYTLRKIALPSSDPVTAAVTELWRECFGQEEVDGTRAQFAGEETQWNQDTLYVLEHEGRLGGCCHITRRRGTGLAMLGGVASAPQFRGAGFGLAVTQFAMADFDHDGGEAIWLCTGNPVAADLYEHLGFRFQAGANVMMRLKGGLRTGDIPRRLYSHGGRCSVLPATPLLRVSMIPLISGRNCFSVLDANVGLCSTGALPLSSCTGLYPRFLQVRQRGGEFLYLQDDANGAVVGLGTVVPAEDGEFCSADAFWRQEYAEQAPELIQALARCFPERKLRFSVIDREKRRVLEALGARPVGEQELAFWRFTLKATVYEYPG